MPLFIQKIPHLLFGVSQRPNVLKDRSHLQSCVNFVARAAYGLAKRPPFAFLGKLSSSLTGIDGVSIFSIQRDDDDRYRVVIQDGAMAVYDMFNGGTSVTVEDRTSDTYLDDAAGAGFRQVTIGDATFIANRGVTVTQGAGKSADKTHYAIITVEQADYGTTYTVTLAGRTEKVTTVVQGDSTSRGQIDTTVIASEIYAELTAGLIATVQWDIQLLGSSIYIQALFNRDFSVSTSDGLGGQGLRLIKGEVKDIEDLFLSRAPHGTKVKVTGDTGTDKDDFWVRYDASGADPDEEGSQGVWKETVGPGLGIKLDKETMPHRLAFNASKIEGTQTIESLPAQPIIQDYFPVENEAGWNEDELGGGVNEEDDDYLLDNTAGRRRLVPGADGTRSYVKIIYSIDTSNVAFGVDTIVRMLHRTVGGTETTLASKTYEPGISKPFDRMAATYAFLSGERVVISVTYGDNLAPASGQEAKLTMLGTSINGKADLTPRYIPITVQQYGGIQVEFTGSYREGVVVDVTLAYTDIVDVFSYTVPAGGETRFQVAAGVAALIDSTGVTDYTSAVLSGSNIRIFVTEQPDADPTFSDIDIRYDNHHHVVPITLNTNEFVGETLRNLTDGSEGTITANTDDGVFEADLAGGTRDQSIEGDIIEIIGTGGYFVWEAVTYDERRVGDITTNPWPSFKDQPIRDIFYYRNRLGLVAGTNVVMSETGDVLNFFRTSIQQLLDGDVIDIDSAHGDVAIFHSAVPFNNSLYLWSENAQYELYGEPVLTPKTVRLDLVSRYFNNPSVRPEAVGPRLYFAHKQAGSGKILEWLPPRSDDETYLARDITQDVPTYLPGQVVDLAGDYNHGILGVLMDGDLETVYIWSFTPKGDGTNIHEAWQEWSLPAGSSARQIDFADGKLALVYSYSDGVYVDEADMDQSIEGETTGFVDRKVDSDTSGVTYSAGTDPASLNPEFQYMFEQDQSPYGGSAPKTVDGWLDTVPESTHDLVEHQPDQGFVPHTDGPVQTQYVEIRSVAMLEDVNGGDTIDLTTDFTVFAVIRVPDLSTQNGHPLFSIFDNADNGLSAGEFNWYVVGNDESSYNTGEVVFTRPYEEDAVIVGTPTLLPEDTWVVLSARMSSRDCRIYINGVECTKQLFTADGTSKPALRVGAFRSNFFTMHADMDMAFLNAYDSAITLQQHSDIVDYLSARYVTGAGGGGGGLVTFPYPVATDGSEGTVKIWRKDTGAEADVTSRPSTTTAEVTDDLDGVDFDVGVAFEARARLAPIYFRDQANAAETQGRSQVRVIEVQYNNTEDLKVEVTPESRSKYTHTVAHASPTEGSKRVPVLSRGETTIIELVSDGAGDCRINSIDIEVQHSNRSRRA